MGAEKENQYWKLRKDMSEDGRKISVEELEIKIQDYIDFCVNNPLKEQVVVAKGIKLEDQTTKYTTELNKMRAMSLWGVCTWLNIVKSTWQEWRKDEKYSAVITRAETLFKSYKFEGAAAGMLHPNIIARDLGLVDKKEQSVKTEQPLFPEEEEKKD